MTLKILWKFIKNILQNHIIFWLRIQLYHQIIFWDIIIRLNDEKLQFDINREAAKISALSLVKIDKYDYVTGEEILPSNSKQIIEPAKFKGKGKAFERQIKTIEDQGKNKLMF